MVRAPDQSVRSVPISPSAMDAGSAPGDLADAPLEEVVATYERQERVRSYDLALGPEAALSFHVRLSPNELVSSLEVIARHLDVSRSVLTRCLSHQAIDWLENSLRVSSLISAFDDVYLKIKSSGRYSPLRKQADAPSYFYVSAEPVSTSVSTVSWVLSRLVAMQQATGIPSRVLLLISLARSITLLEHKEWDSGNIAAYFQPEVDNLRLHIGDRFIDIAGLHSKFDLRENLWGNR